MPAEKLTPTEQGRIAEIERAIFKMTDANIPSRAARRIARQVATELYRIAEVKLAYRERHAPMTPGAFRPEHQEDR